MSDKVILITPPDDVLLDGLRILLVDLTPEQSQLISNALTQIESIPTVIVYVWKTNDSIDWLLDKKLKNELIIFNAESENNVIVGYMAAQANSHYFGTLRSLSLANDSTIYNTDQIINILEKTIEQHGRQIR